jgi:hypothetical protein
VRAFESPVHILLYILYILYIIYIIYYWLLLLLYCLTHPPPTLEIALLKKMSAFTGFLDDPCDDAQLFSSAWGGQNPAEDGSMFNIEALASLTEEEWNQVLYGAEFPQSSDSGAAAAAATVIDSTGNGSRAATSSALCDPASAPAAALCTSPTMDSPLSLIRTDSFAAPSASPSLAKATLFDPPAYSAAVDFENLSPKSKPCMTQSIQPTDHHHHPPPHRSSVNAPGNSMVGYHHNHHHHHRHHHFVGNPISRKHLDPQYEDVTDSIPVYTVPSRLETIICRQVSEVRISHQFAFSPPPLLRIYAPL